MTLDRFVHHRSQDTEHPHHPREFLQARHSPMTRLKQSLPCSVPVNGCSSVISVEVDVHVHSLCLYPFLVKKKKNLNSSILFAAVSDSSVLLRTSVTKYVRMCLSTHLSHI